MNVRRDTPGHEAPAGAGRRGASPHPLAGTRVLVTGGRGFIGSRLMGELLASGCDVHATTRSEDPLSDPRPTWHRADLGDHESVQAVFAAVRPDVVFHLAAHVSGARGIDVVQSTLHGVLVSTVGVLSAAVEYGGPRVVLAGSMEEPVAERQPVPASPYAAAKWAASGYARMFHALYDLPLVALRIFMVYGPGPQDERRVIPYTTLALLRGLQPQLTSGTRAVDWVYVDDVVDAFIRAARAVGVEGRTIDIGSGVQTTIREIVDKLVMLVDPRIEPLFGALEDRALETAEAADVGPAATSLGWSPRTSLDAGLRATVDWYAERERLPPP